MIKNRLVVLCCLVAGGFAPHAAALTPTELAARLARNEPLLVVDVRSAFAYGEGHIPGAINIPLALLPHKPLPQASAVIVYGDGLGVVDDTRALALAREKPGVTAEVLEGGYAGWLAETRLSTAAPGVTAEKVPGITYQQLLAAGKSDMVLVDVRKSASAPATAASGAGRPATAAMTRDIVADFGRKIGVSVIAPPGTAVAASRTQRAASSVAGTPPRAAAPAPANESKSARLMVLVADNDSEANEVARQLRASGHYRFTVLIGGTEAIRHEGRSGTGRMDGDLPVVPNPR